MMESASRTSRIVASIGSLLLLVSGASFATPLLQVDLQDGYYDSVTETVVTELDEFSVYVLGTPHGENGNGIGTLDQAGLLAETFYLGIAVVPQHTSPGTDIGYFTVNGTFYNSASMEYGTPPVDLWAGNPDKELPGHGVYDTLFMQLAFQFDPSSTVGTYNVQGTPGAFSANFPGTGSFFEAFQLDISGLNDGFELHFDVFNSELVNNPKTEIDKDAVFFAPFSHDGETGCCREVPEPGTLALLGLGLFGIGVMRRRSLI